MKIITSFTASVFLLLFAGWCFAQGDAEGQQIGTKKSAASAEASLGPQPEQKRSERALPSDADAIFPAVVAKVNGEEVLGRELEALVRDELSAIGSPKWKDLRGEYRGELTLNKITSLINSKLIYQKATASSVAATDGEVEAELQKFAETFKSDAEMNTALATQNMDRPSLKRKLREALTVSKYLEEAVTKKISISAKEMEEYYSSHPEEFHHPDMVKTSHILIPVSEDTPDSKAKELAEALLARANKGEDFAKLAEENSADASASRGGDIGFISRDMLVPEYSEAAFSLPVGGARVVRTQFGYHVIKVTDKKQEGIWTLEDIKPQLTEFLRRQKYQQGLNELIDQLREKANIEILISAKELLNPAE